MITVLMVDDYEGVAETVKDTVRKAKIRGLKFDYETDFSKGFKRIKDKKPDIVILDKFLGPPQEDNAAGEPLWGKIWKENFCPIIIYTAGEDSLEPSPPKDHPFIRILKKGRGSDQNVVKCIKDFIPHVDAMHRVHSEINNILRETLKDTAPYVLQGKTTDLHQPEILSRTARRRVAAMMDESLLTGGTLFDWERYVIPPIGRDPCIGDVLRTVGSDPNDASAYRIILSPSCDMVTGQRRVSRSLVAKCCDCCMFAIKGLGWKYDTHDSDKVRNRLKTALTQSNCEGFLSLPELPGILPHMSLNLRDLDLIELDKIGDHDNAKVEFERIVSIDSPFREQIAWAYLQIAGRPGLPDRDFTSTIDGIFMALNHGKQKQG
jgi:hypothetical protein